MKKLAISILTLLLIFTLPTVSNSANETHKPKTTVPVGEKESRILLHRLDEIKAMDKSDMSASEKKALRKEVKSIREKLGSGGIYISVGAAILIVLILILLL